ncbi:MAG TPA: hypothetical protein VGJ26_21880 [Pirellulales bacterium]
MPFSLGQFVDSIDRFLRGVKPALRAMLGRVSVLDFELKKPRGGRLRGLRVNNRRQELHQPFAIGCQPLGDLREEGLLVATERHDGGHGGPRDRLGGNGGVRRSVFRLAGVQIRLGLVGGRRRGRLPCNRNGPFLLERIRRLAIVIVLRRSVDRAHDKQHGEQALPDRENSLELPFIHVGAG